MVILMDAGNSRVKWAWFDDVIHSNMDEAEATNNFNQSVTAVNYKDGDKLSTIKALLDTHQPTKLLIVHVLGDAFDRKLEAYCLANTIEYRVTTSKTASCGVINGYPIVEQLGSDRFVAMIGAYHLYPNDNLIVIDAGTAVTIDGLTKKGRHLGGVIMPGLQLWSDSLIKSTQLPSSLIVNNADVCSTDTKKGINSGSLYGLAGAVQHICNVMDNDKFAESIPPKISPKILSSERNSAIRIICGGDSELLSQFFTEYGTKSGSDESRIPSNRYKVIPNLVIHGLIIIEKNNA